MKEQNIDIPLHDIKPLLEIEEYSLYYFLGVSLLLLLLACGTLYLIYKYIKNKNRFNLKKEHLRLLNSIDLSDAKRAAYDITFYGSSFKDDSQRHHEMYENLVSRLQKYKYKKEVEPIDEETLGYIELYRGMCDV
jgi:hypothetical protein